MERLSNLEKSELDKKFLCYGHFFNIVYKGHVMGKCRSILEIVNKNLTSLTDTDKLKKDQPKAVVVMMNPGISEPSQLPQKVDIKEVYLLSKSTKQLCLATPDESQYMIMKIMKDKRWDHVKVLNLSDLRASSKNILNDSIEKFVSNTAQFEEKYHHSHSIFSSIRRDELMEVFADVGDVPFIRAWGVDNCLLSYFAPLSSFLLTGKKCIDFPKLKTINRFYHPLHNGWVTNITAKLRNID